LLNIHLGGSLNQELRSQRKLTSNRWTVLPLKTLKIEPGTLLYRVLNCHRCRISSLHNQAINRCGRHLGVSGRDLDGIAQAVENPAYGFLLGVQWHPEFLLFLPRQRALFGELVRRAKPAGAQDGLL